MGYSLSNSKREIHSNISLPQEARKISSKQSNLVPKETRKRIVNKAQSEEKDGNNKNQKGRKQKSVKNTNTP